MSDLPEGAAMVLPGMLYPDAFNLANEINKTEGWYAIMVGTWRPGQRPLTPRYRVKCAKVLGTPLSGWYWVERHEEWKSLRDRYQTTLSPAVNANE